VAGLEAKALVAPAVWTDACQRLDADARASLARPVRVESIEESQGDRAAEVQVDGVRVGSAPGTVAVPLCGSAVTLVASDTGERWEAKLGEACASEPCVLRARFPARVRAELLPSWAAVPREVIEQLNTHAAFRGAPTARPVEYASKTRFHKDPSASYETTYAWRPAGGVLNGTFVADYSSDWSGGGTYRSKNSGTALSALNGLLSLGSRTESDVSYPGSSERKTGIGVITALTKVEGRLFPLARGNRLSFTVTYTNREESGAATTVVQQVALEVVDDVAGETVLAGLPGRVFLVKETRTSGEHTFGSTHLFSEEYGATLGTQSSKDYSTTLTRVVPLRKP
ncbi:MAG: hypothetical protein ACK4N5_21505, partial [Myxococcales bacterium]